MARAVSRREVLRYSLPAAAATAMAGPAALAAPLSAPKASAQGLLLIDFATRLVQPEQIKTAGYHGALAPDFGQWDLAR